VRRLKLRSTNPDAIQHGAFVVEDALRTASLPGLPQNGLLLIRHLDLGKFAANPTSVSVAHRIASRLLTLNVSIIRPNAAEQPSAGIVWFPDIIEPYVILAGLLARHVKPQSWYWPRAVKGWSARMSPEQGLRHALYEVSRTPVGVAGAARVVEHVISASGLDVLGRTLQPSDGQKLLALGGIHFPDQITGGGAGVRTSGQIQHIDRSWRQAFKRFILQWGRRDDRTTWLAHVAICARRGMPSSDAAAGLLQELRQPQDGSSAAERQKRLPPLVPKSGIAEATYLGHPGSDLEKQRPIQNELAETSPQARTAGLQANSSSRVPGADEYPQAMHDTSAQSNDQPIRAKQCDRSGMTGTENRRPHRRSTPASQDDLNSSIAPEDPSIARHEPSDSNDHETRPSTATSTAQENTHRPQQRRDTAAGTGAKDLAGVESPSAGLVFAVQALEWLGIRETLTAYPVLEWFRLPAWILWHCVDQLKISHDDPICEFLPTPEPVPAGTSVDFVAPAGWRNFCRPPGSDEKILTVRRIRNTPGKRILHDDSRKLTIALWKNQIPAAVRRWAQGCTLQRQSAVQPVDDLILIIHAYLSAIGCFLKKYAQIDLRRMVNRPGHVATTRTHLDVTFDPKQLDIGIRRAGLDIDPGWVPWLGRVVYIHYQGREEIIDV
jgi:hypothetical protein